MPILRYEVDGETIAYTGTDENAVNVSEGASVTLKDVTITRDSSESTGGDNSSFYGVGAAVLATDGNAYVKGGTVTTDTAGGAGLFAYNNGTVYAAIRKSRPNRIHQAVSMQPAAECSMHGILMLRQTVSLPQRSEVTAEAEKW